MHDGEALGVPSELPVRRVSPYRLLVAAALAVVGVTLAAVETLPDPQFLALFALVVGFFAVSAFDVVREHDLFTLAQAVWTASLFGLLLLVEPQSVFLTALAGLSVAGVVVETYNYVAGTSYLRVEW